MKTGTALGVAGGGGEGRDAEGVEDGTADGEGMGGLVEGLMGVSENSDQSRKLQYPISGSM